MGEGVERWIYPQISVLHCRRTQYLVVLLHLQPQDIVEAESGKETTQTGIITLLWSFNLKQRFAVKQYCVPILIHARLSPLKNKLFTPLYL